MTETNTDVDVVEMKDALIFGDIDPDVLSHQIEIARGSNRHDKFWSTIRGTVGQLLSVLVVRREGDKDGPALTQGGLAGPQRVANNVKAEHVIMVDVDNGTTIEELTEILQGAGYFSIVWSTHSHGQPTTFINETTLNTWRRQKRTPVTSDDELVRAYLADVKKYKPHVIDSITEVRRDHIEGGVHFIVSHAPMDRLRFLCVLKEPFSFSDGTHGAAQKDAIEAWKKTYAAFCDRLGVGYDRSCTDPSRLMYLPSRPKGSDPSKFPTYVLAGGLVDLAQFEPKTAPAATSSVLDAFTEYGGGDGAQTAYTFKTPGLSRWFGRGRQKSFEAAEFAVHYAPDSLRHDYGDKIEFRCPFDEQHSTPNPDDRGFMIRSASMVDNGSGFSMVCQHSSCKERTGGDRAVYLDEMCAQFGISDAADLDAFCTDEVERIDANIETTARVEAAIENVTEDMDAQALRPVMREIAEIDDEIDRTFAIGNLSRVVRALTRTEIKRIVRDFRREIEEHRRAEEQDDDTQELMGPQDPDTYDVDGPIQTFWTFDRMRATVLSLIHRKTDVNGTPILFTQSGANCAYIAHNSQRGNHIWPLDRREDWFAFLADHFLFLDDEGSGKPAPQNLVSALVGQRNWNLPVIDKVYHTPVLAPDFTVRTEVGYSAAMWAFLDPLDGLEPLPDEISPDDVNEAMWWLDEVFRDFPFSDAFDGNDMLPIKLDESDDDGFPLPNMARGRGSRLACYTMLLQHFVRPVITGPCPAYHIDKPRPGTGANYLVDAHSLTQDGQPAPIQVMSKHEEESRKAITAVLRSGPTTIFFDNINHHVDSGTLAAAITAGVWRDRILGQSTDVELPIKATVIFAGNQLTFSTELMRRLIPIRLDAATPHPAIDRKANDFKHDLQQFVLDNRRSIVRACLVLAKNWAQRKDAPGFAERVAEMPVIHSFNRWSTVMAGIWLAVDDALVPLGFEAIAPNFMAHRPGYLVGTSAPAEDETNNYAEMLSHLHRKYKDRELATSDIWNEIKDPLNGGPMFDVGIKGFNESGYVSSLGRIMNSKVVGQTFNLLVDGRDTRVRVSRRVLHGKSLYSIRQISTAQVEDAA